jgi:ABC-type transport system involved in multi-copper enzyme maturation permease subunit
VSVSKRSYRSYAGPLTPLHRRFLVIARFGLVDVWQSRVTVILFVLCLIPPLLSLFFIYVTNSETARVLLGIQGLRLIEIDEKLFVRLLMAQCWLALLPAAWIGPRLISQDLAHNALPIILSRPITRREYVLGKLTVLGGILSVLTWVPLLALFLFQAKMSSAPWFAPHLFIAVGIVAGSMIWVMLLSLLALALSAWVRWRIVATALVFGAIFVSAGFGTVFNAVMRSNIGTVLNLPVMMSQLWFALLHVSLPRFGQELPISVIVISLAAMCAACGAALNARIRAREVVRG